MDTLLQILYISSFKKVEEQIKMKRMKILTKSILFIIILSICICMVTQILKPQIPAFYKEKHYDAVFFGTSQSYCSFDPEIFDEYELKTYNRGRQQQTMNYTYFYIKDALESCDIDVIVLEIFGMFYEEGDERFEDADIRDSSLNDFPLSSVRMEMIQDCVPENLRWSYLFPLDKYHARWQEFDYSSWSALYNKALYPYYEETDRGYVRIKNEEVCVDDYWSIVFSDVRREVNENNLNYLEKIYDLCRKKGVKLLLVKGPLPCYDRVVEETNTVMDWADAHNVGFINYMRQQDVLEMNFYTDSSDGGTHLNEKGASRVSRHLAQYLNKYFFMKH